jgi:CheY-like chemotaxis protein
MTCHVLIIEDEPIAAMDIEAILEKQGATSFAFAETEQEAIVEASRERPDIITADVNLRVGSGPHAVQTILDSLGPLPVIFITGSPASCSPFDPPARILQKPVQEAALAKAFHDLAPDA